MNRYKRYCAFVRSPWDTPYGNILYAPRFVIRIEVFIVFYRIINKTKRTYDIKKLKEKTVVVLYAENIFISVIMLVPEWPACGNYERIGFF